MILKTEEFKDACSKIWTAVDTQETSSYADSVELKVEDNTLYLCVTNREYYVQVKFDIDEDEDFHATVKAALFLKLISQITTDTIELTATDNNLKIVGNGTYKIPLVYDEDTNELLELPQVEINNKVNDFYINSETLLSILKYNSDELNKGNVSKPVQNFYYVDEKGAITFTSGACVNNFTLSEPIKILLNNRLVKLFKLFKSGDVHFTLGLDPISSELNQTRVRFETDTVVISSKLVSGMADMLETIPVKSIRDRANKKYENVVFLNKNDLSNLISRLSLFTQKSTPYGVFEFDTDHVTVFDKNKENKEVIYYSKPSIVNNAPYTLNLDLNNLELTLKSSEDDAEFRFGDSRAMIMVKGNIIDIMPEIKFSR